MQREYKISALIKTLNNYVYWAVNGMWLSMGWGCKWDVTINGIGLSMGWGYQWDGAVKCAWEGLLY